MRKILIVAAVLVAALSACTVIAVMRNPETGEIVQCPQSAAATSGVDLHAQAEQCAAGYEAAGWERMN